MNNKTLKIVLIVLFMFLVLTIGLIVYKNVNKPNEETEESTEKPIQDENQESNIEFDHDIAILIDRINQVNSIINTDLSNSDTYPSSDGAKTCYNYNKEDVDTYINLLNMVYVVPFMEGSNFELKEINGERKLYVCKSESTSVSPIDISDVTFSRIENGIKYIKIKEDEYALLNTPDGLQFTSFVGIQN